MSIPISHNRIAQTNSFVSRTHGKKEPSLPPEGNLSPSESVSLGQVESTEPGLPKAFRDIGISPKLLEKFTQAKRAFVPTAAHGPLSVALYFSLDKLDESAQTSDMQGRELDYVSELSKRQNFATLSDGLKERDDSIATHYTDSRSGLKHFDAKLSQHLDEKGIVPGQLPLLLQGRANEPLNEDNSKLLNDSIERLSHQFFGDVPEDKGAMKHFLGTFTRQLVDNSRENLSETLNLKETHQLLSHMSSAVYHQERAANETPIGDHGIDHLIKHNVNWAQGTFDQLQEQGVPISAKDRLLASMVMVYHDMGYTAPSVVESVERIGIQRQDRGHGVVGARYVRELSEQKETPFQKLLKPEDWNLFHRGVLYHDRTQEALPVEKFIVSANPSQEERVHNFESAIRLADNAHGFGSKVSKPLAKNPESLKYLRMMQVAKDLKSDGLDTAGFNDSFFKGKLADSWSKLEGVLPDRLIKGGEKLTELLTPGEARFISGRLMDSDPFTNVRKDGGVELVFPTGRNPMQQFGVSNESRQQSKMLEDLDPKSQDGSSDILEVSYMPLTQESESDFMQRLSGIFLEDTKFKDFNQTENHSRALSESSAQILDRSAGASSPERWLQNLQKNPLLSNPKLGQAYEKISASDNAPIEKVGAFRAVLQQHRAENFSKYCSGTTW